MLHYSAARDLCLVGSGVCWMDQKAAGSMAEMDCNQSVEVQCLGSNELADLRSKTLVVMKPAASTLVLPPSVNAWSCHGESSLHLSS